MERIGCNCKTCGARVGIFVNLWMQVGRSYFSPILDPQSDLSVIGQGDVRVGEQQTLVADWYVPTDASAGSIRIKC
jgi:hypothetical protein